MANISLLTSLHETYSECFEAKIHVKTYDIKQDSATTKTRKVTVLFPKDYSVLVEDLTNLIHDIPNMSPDFLDMVKGFQDSPNTNELTIRICEIAEQILKESNVYVLSREPRTPSFAGDVFFLDITPKNGKNMLLMPMLCKQSMFDCNPFLFKALQLAFKNVYL